MIDRLADLQSRAGLYVIVQIRERELYRDFKVRGLRNPGKVRGRVFELTSQTHQLCNFSRMNIFT
jgi:hypothetical protein